MDNVMRKTFMLAAALAGICLVPASAVRASSDFVTLDFAGDAPARLGYIKYDGRTVLTQVGQSIFHVHDEAGSYGGLGADIVQASKHGWTTGYCIDVYQAISIGRNFQFDVMDLSKAPTLASPDRAKDLERLFAKHADDVNSPDTAAAFAAAVWEIVDETTTDSHGKPVYDVRGGDFRVVPASRWEHWDLLADRWLASLGTDTQPAYALVSTTVQDFAWILPAQHGCNPPVPEPLTFVSGFLAVSGLGFYMRKRAKVTA